MRKIIFTIFSILIFTFLLDGKNGFSADTMQGDDSDPLAFFLNELKVKIEDHDWNAVLMFFNEENFETQRSLGISVPQYIEEGLGMGMINNHLVEREDDQTEFSKLNNIKRIDFESVVKENEMITVTGRVEQVDGSFRECSFSIHATGTGEYKITPAVG